MLSKKIPLETVKQLRNSLYAICNVYYQQELFKVTANAFVNGRNMRQVRRDLFRRKAIGYYQQNKNQWVLQ